ncbi:MAG: hypothetical protein Ta2B_16440 [Termitinemataceae bacterium]|nr:MAG: hypothetical protein Ta2B_16440 [Termitinemataceae bacterium]
MAKNLIIKIVKIFDVLFIISSFLALVFQIIYLIINKNDELIFNIMIGPIITFFYRMAMAGFFYLFALFFEDWIKVE